MVLLHVLASIIYGSIILYTPIWYAELVAIIGLFYSGYRSGRILQATIDTVQLQNVMMEARKEIYQFVASYGSPKKPEDKLNKEEEWLKNN